MNSLRTPATSGLLLLCGCATEAATLLPEHGDGWRAAMPAAARAPAAVPSSDLAPKEGDRRAFVGVGTLSSPDAFLLGGDADFYQSNRVAIGPSLQLGLDDNVEVYAGTFHAKFVFPFDRAGDS